MQVSPALALFGCFILLFVLVLLPYVNSLRYNLTAQSVELRDLRESLYRRDKHIKALNDRPEKPRDAGVCQSVSVHMQPPADDAKDAQIQQLTEKLRLAEEDYSTRLETIRNDSKRALNRRMEGLLRKKAKDDAAKDQEIAELKKDLLSGRTHEMKMAQVSQRLHGELTDRESQIDELRFSHRIQSREACGRCDGSGLTALYNHYNHMISSLRSEEERSALSHEQALASMSQGRREREVGLMRACVRDLENAVRSVDSRESSLALDRRIGQWRGSIEELQREMGEE
ncbi:hypothetical protein Slin15195_G092190 [Septoria linicola]|uniref:Uncharacterized protein n=1 Tax=Septoria linicola TaxID=215465 RepID=A0A9Q9B0H7_9PEZI|nr:hypothetical protein Slin15195_G092190 [Septoria linicola]